MSKAILFIVIAASLTACNGTSKQDDTTVLSQQKTIDSLNAIKAKSKTINEAKSTDFKNGGENPQNSTDGTSATAKKKGWTGAEKGAAIGAGAGILTGVIADKKNRAAGAVIGGVSGAAVGAGAGALIDAKKKQSNP